MIEKKVQIKGKYIYCLKLTLCIQDDLQYFTELKGPGGMERLYRVGQSFSGTEKKTRHFYTVSPTVRVQKGKEAWQGFSIDLALQSCHNSHSGAPAAAVGIL